MNFFNRYRIVALITVVLGTALLMFIGKQHTVFIDNKAYEMDGERLEPFETVMVRDPDQGEFEIYEDDFDSVTPVGPFYNIAVEIPGGGGNEDVAVNKRIFLGFSDTVRINVPLLVREAGK
ncbi:MAG: hypothetical protein LBT08_04815 [Synergistaceae bacterium]|jgi:hypothetical protein|nr:hypothetical protein [Synergistaceae bacterium]